jgi:hypothetical protein
MDHHTKLCLSEPLFVIHAVSSVQNKLDLCFGQAYYIGIPAFCTEHKSAETQPKSTFDTDIQ